MECIAIEFFLPQSEEPVVKGGHYRDRTYLSQSEPKKQRQRRVAPYTKSPRVSNGSNTTRAYTHVPGSSSANNNDANSGSSSGTNANTIDDLGDHDIDGPDEDQQTQIERSWKYMMPRFARSYLQYSGSKENSNLKATQPLTLKHENCNCTPRERSIHVYFYGSKHEIYMFLLYK